MAPVNGSSNGKERPVTYVAVQPKLSKQHSRVAIASLFRHGQPNVIEATFEKLKHMTWQQKLAMVFVGILWRINKYLKLFGFLVEWTLNLLALNNGLFSLLYKVFLFKWGASFHIHLALFVQWRIITPMKPISIEVASMILYNLVLL